MIVNDLILCNTGSEPTFETVTHGVARDSIIDLTLKSNLSNASIHDWKVDPNISPSSDHNAITFKIKTGNIPLTKNAKLSTFQYNTSNIKWPDIKEQFRNTLNKHLRTVAHTNVYELDAHGIDTYVDHLTRAIQTACDEILPKSKGLPRKAPWWNEQLTDLKQKVISNHRELSKRKKRGLPLDECIVERSSLRKEYSDAICKASQDHFREFCTTQGTDDVWTITNRIIKARPVTQPPSTLKLNNGMHTKSSDETAKALLDWFYPDNTPDHTAEQKNLASLMDHPIDTPPESPFTTEEILNCLKFMNPKKAPGTDHLTSDICYHFASLFPETITNLLNRCLAISHFPKSWKVAVAKIIPKPNKTEFNILSSFRPIGLINVFGKLLEKLTINRLNHHSYINNYDCKAQYGFKLQTSTTDAIHAALDTIRSSITGGKHVIAASLDIKAAFDNAWWPAVFKRLRDIECPSNIYLLLRDYVRNRTVTLKFSDCCLNKDLTKGCIQGSVCGPTLWNLILDELLNLPLPEGCSLQAYADDVLLITTDNTIAFLEEKTNKALELIGDWGRSVKLNFGPDKTVIVPFTNKSKNCKIIINNQNIQFQNQFKYLGIIIDSKLRFIKHTDFIIEKAKKLFNKLIVFVKPTWGVHPDNVKIIYEHVIQPIITYGASIWANALKYKYVQGRFLSLQRLFAIKMVQGFRTLSTAASISIAQLSPLPSKILAVADIELTKLHGKSKFLPDDVTIEPRATPDTLLHPSDRIPLKINEIGSHHEFNLLPTECNQHKVYTDGSKSDEGKVGAAFVIIKPNGDQSTHKYKLHDCCSVFQAELLAISKAIEHIIKHKISSTNIYSDSMSGLTELSNPNSTNHIVNSIHHKINNAKNLNINISFYWVKAHVGIPGNEAADTAAKAAALLHKAPDYTLVPISFVKHIHKQHLHEASIELYTKTSPHIRNLLPNYKSLTEYLNKIKPHFAITQNLTNHGYHKEYLHRFHITSDSICPCDNLTEQSLKHLIEECPRFCNTRLSHEIVATNLINNLYNLTEILKYNSTIDSYHKHITYIVKNLKNFNKTNNSASQTQPT